MNVAIMGYGTVGSGVAEVLKKNHEHIVKKSLQESLDLKYILDLRDFPGDPNEKLVIKDFNTILNDETVGVVVETMGGLRPAFEFVSACLKAGKSVVTSNKELVAAKGLELLALAEENNVNFLFEASVGGGIPIIRPIIQCLSANEIEEVAGILNGTTNYILTKMFMQGTAYEDALADAQRLGYAERDPSADVDGIDACRKICILADLCFGKEVKPDSFCVEGIRNITSEDVGYARAWGGVIKLIASAKSENGGKNISLRVSPAFISGDSQLACVNDVFNAILVRGNALGDVVFYGRGAGKLPTASAVVADVIDCARHSDRRKPFGWSSAPEGFVLGEGDFTSRFFVRTSADKQSVLSDFANAEFITFEGAPAGETAFISGMIKKQELDEKLAALGGVKSVIRVTDY